MDVITTTVHEIIKSPVAIDKNTARKKAEAFLDAISQSGGGMLRSKLVSTNLDAVADEMKYVLAERALQMMVEKELGESQASNDNQ